jgi:hypothetical protein
LTNKLPKSASQSTQVTQFGNKLTTTNFFKDRSLIVAEATKNYSNPLFTAQTSTSAGKNASGAADPSDPTNSAT